MEPFRVGDEIVLPELAKQQGLDAPDFVVERVVRGGMSLCALVRPRHGGGSYALKVPASGLLGDPGARERFLDELRVWLALSACESIVEALCVFRYDGLPAVVSRWMAGGSLRNQLGRRDPAFFYETILRVAGALEWAARRKSVLHRDIKPENVLFDDLGRAQLSDWGIAGFLEEGTDGRKRAPAGAPLKGKEGKARLILGTVTYASPEQLLGGVPVDLRTDIYSLGTIMYEWEAGEPPFAGGSWEELRKRKLFEEARPLGGFLRRTTFGAEEVVARCLARERGGRFEDYRAFTAALLLAAAERGVEVARHVPRLRYQTEFLDAEALKGRMSMHGFVSVVGTDGRRASVSSERAREAVERAQVLEREERWAEAHEQYARFFLPSLARELPDDPLQQTMALGLARTLLRLERAEEALRSLDALAGASVRPAEATRLAVQASLQLGDPAQAERIAYAALASLPGDGELLRLLLEARLALGRDDLALETVRQLVAAEGSDPAATVTLAHLLVRTAAALPESQRPESLRRLAEAVVRLSVPLVKEETGNEALETIVRALGLAGRWDEALGELDGEALPEGEAGRARAELTADALLEAGRWEECLSRGEGWLRAWPGSALLRRAAARALVVGLAAGLSVSGGEEAGEAARHALETSLGESPEAGDLLALAAYYEWKGRGRKALDLLERWTGPAAGAWRLHVARARLLTQDGQFKPALAAAEEAARLAPFRAEAWKALAAIRRTLGWTEAEEEALRRAEEVESELAAAWQGAKESAEKGASGAGGRSPAF
ncbi:MAG: protein kinase domain-containing protein [Acidithiobacillales bacterium]